MDKYKNALKIAGVYVGLIIGAGFASGREIITFFISYGKMWPLGLVLTGVLFAVVGYIILSIIEKENIKSYSGFLQTIMSEKTAGIMELVSGLFLCVIFFAMVSAFGSIFYEAFGINRLSGSAILTVLCFIVFRGGVEKLIELNTILSPMMIVGTVFVCLYTYFTKSKYVFMGTNFGVKMPVFIVFSALIYVSYNIITAVSVFAETKDVLKKDKFAKYGAVLGGMILAFLGIIMGVVLAYESTTIVNADIPMLLILNKSSMLVTYVYIVVLMGAVITTAVGNGYGAVKWLEDKVMMKSIIIEIFICLSAFLTSNLGFSQFTDKIYPLFGFLGLAEIFCVFKYFLTHK